MKQDEIMQTIDKAKEDMRLGACELKKQYNKSLDELRNKIINTLPLKVGDVLTRYAYKHYSSSKNPPIGKEKVKIASIVIDTDGLIVFKYQKWNSKTNKWLKADTSSYRGVKGVMCLYEKDNIFYDWCMEVDDGKQGLTLPTPDMEIPNI